MTHVVDTARPIHRDRAGTPGVGHSSRQVPRFCKLEKDVLRSAVAIAVLVLAHGASCSPLQCASLIQLEDRFLGPEGQTLRAIVCLNQRCTSEEVALPLAGRNPAQFNFGRNQLVLRRLTALSSSPQEYALELDRNMSGADDDLKDGDVLEVELIDLEAVVVVFASEDVLDYTNNQECKGASISRVADGAG